MTMTCLTGMGGESIALLGVAVRADVVAGHASAVVQQRYRNTEAKPIEAIYTFPLPTNAALTGFSMTVNGQRIEGEVKERDEAFRTYDDAITAGHGSALLDQERANVFTASVGNLLPGEETLIEITYVEPVVAEEGAVRWSLPTLVAPRYVPGHARGDRSAHGSVDPTDRVPDADRISPPVGMPAYGLTLDLVFDLGVAVEAASPSHPVVVRREGTRTFVRFSSSEVALDRDVVVTASAIESADTRMPFASAVSHRVAGEAGTFAFTLVPDLAAGASSSRSDVVFLLDRSGSMGGPSMTEARTALRLCLRQLREGDRFTILAFDTVVEPFSPALVPFTQSTLAGADAWLARVDARGGTELLEPVVAASRLVPDGIVVLLTDGQVANEDEILERWASQRPAGARGRIYSFGIGTNVSDALLQALAERSGGAVERIHPGERIDEKVVAQFARATARRVTDLSVKARGFEIEELAPAELRPLVDGEPWTMFGRYTTSGRGAIEVRGTIDGEPFFLEAPIELEESSHRPLLAKLWARARIRELELAAVVGRRAEAMKDRIVKLAVTHGVSSKYTSFVLVEKRTGERRAVGQPMARVVPVNAPAGWAKGAPAASGDQARASKPNIRPMAMPARRMVSSPASMPAPAPMPPAVTLRAPAPAGGMASPPRRSIGYAPPPMASARSSVSSSQPRYEGSDGASSDEAVASPEPTGAGPGALLSRQNAEGLWEEAGRDSVAVTIDAFVQLYRASLTTSDPMYGAQIRKALEAWLARVATTTVPAHVLELGLAVAWLLATGRRTQSAIEQAATHRGLPVRNEAELRQVVAAAP